MTRCHDFYTKWEKCGPDWCEQAKSGVSQINTYLGIVGEIESEVPRDFTFVNFPEGIARKLQKIRKPNQKKEVVDIVKKRLQKRVHLNDNLKSGEAPINTKISSKEMDDIIDQVTRAPHREEMKLRGESIIGLSDSIQLYHGDFLTDYKKIPEESVDCIITDPPYVKEWLDNYAAFAEASAYVLKPGGFLISYVGHIHLDRILSDMTSYLDYFWIMTLIHSGTTSAVHSRSVQCGFKPILVMNKPPRVQPKRYFNDVIKGSGKEKDAHEWQQGEEELRQIFEPFTDPGDIVLDPFMGSGTVLSMAKKMNRRAMGWDINKDNVDVVRGRLV